MKAIIRTGPRSVEIQEQGVPTPGADELLIRVHTAELCGSNAHAYKYNSSYGQIPIPRIMGHGYSRTVTEAGANARTFEIGDRTVEEPTYDYGRCSQCRGSQPNVCQSFSITGMHRDGAYTEYVTVTPERVHVAPEGVPLRHAAIMEPVSIAIRTVLDQSVTMSGNNVLVERLGLIGVFAAAITDSLGTNVVVSGLSQDAVHRLPLLEDLGIDTVNPEEKGDLDERVELRTDSIDFDAIFGAAGHHSDMVSGDDVVRKGGQTVVVGIPNSANELSLASTVRGEVDINISCGSIWTNFEQALCPMERGGIVIEKILDTSYSVDDPVMVFEAFLGLETCKPIFQFDG